MKFWWTHQGLLKQMEKNNVLVKTQFCLYQAINSVNFQQKSQGGCRRQCGTTRPSQHISLGSVRGHRTGF